MSFFSLIVVIIDSICVGAVIGYSLGVIYWHKNNRFESLKKYHIKR